MGLLSSNMNNNNNNVKSTYFKVCLKIFSNFDCFNIGQSEVNQSIDLYNNNNITIIIVIIYFAHKSAINR